ncbi:bric-a-brac protein [Perilla frutescens var. hirtella]|uniref:Bric-a-brac protein n=1 Tax=Perilla frutescens var. hirtella TaxID=608512 RepID=A0AAD4JNQ8_PERFH|nr:bric-a-brac protein [Perilla frutescens var. hirtella]
MLPFSTRKQLTLAVCGLLTGVTFIAIGAHYSYANIGPQQARTQARNEYVKARLRKLLQD